MVDEAYLNAPDTVYPVTIDPGINVGASGIEDATIYSNYRVNEGQSSSVFAGNYSQRHGGRGTARLLVKFPGLFSNSTFKSLKTSQIQSVTYYVRDVMCESEPVWIDCYRATSSWTESGIKCNNTIWNAYTDFQDDALVYYNNGTAGYNSTAAGHWYGFNITNAVKGWKNGSYANNGIMLKGYNENKGARTFASAERAQHTPVVVVDYGVAVSQVCLTTTYKEMEVDDTAYLYASVVPYNANQSVTFTSSNSSVVSVGYSSGLLCAKSAGTATITVRSSFDTSKYATCTVKVSSKPPSKFADLRTKGLIVTSDITVTADNFYVCTKSMADILTSAGISTLYDTSNSTKTPSVYLYYDDWYIFAAPAGSDYTYGLYKMREQEHDSSDGDADDPGVTISFVKFNTDLLFTCLNTKTRNNCLALNQEIDRVVQTPGEQYDSDMQVYFSNPASEGAYLIAETYTKFIAGTAVNGNIAASNQYLNLMERIEELDRLIDSPFTDTAQVISYTMQKEKLMRVPNGLTDNNEKAGYAVFSNNQIHIQSPSNPTSYERYAILMMHTANVTYNSFAAEVKFHSDALVDLFSGIDDYYNRALRADMALGEENESGFFDSYYDLEGELVQEQIRYHGEC